MNNLFQQINCTIPSHSDHKVSRICVNKDCKDFNLVCDLCDKAHSKHREKLISIAEVQATFLQLKNSDQKIASSKSIQKIIAEFENLSYKKLKELNSDLQQLLYQTNLMEISFLNNKISSSYTELQNQVTQLLNYVELQNGELNFKILQPSDLYPKIHEKLTKYLQEINNFWKKNTGYGEPQQYIEKIFQLNSQQQQINQQSPPKKIQILNSETKIVSLQQELDSLKLLQQSKIPLQEQLKSSKFSLQDELNTFQFKSEFCSQYIRCITPKCVQKNLENIIKIQMIQTKMDIACLNKPLSLNVKKSFVFKINSLKGSIGIGIAIYCSVEVNNFMIGPLDEIGHGAFLVLNNGLIYNNSYPKYNRINEQIEFKEDQIYILTFDPLNKEGKQFQIQQLSQNTQPFTMPICIDENLDYHVLVSMEKKDDEVELLNEI